MAVSKDYDKINIILNNSAVQFAIDFDTNFDDYGNAINIEVYLGLERLVQNTDFTISGKTINYPDAVNHQGEKLTIFRLTPIEQPVDFVDNGNFTLEDIEAMGDRAIMILQEQGTNLNDTVSAQESAEKAELAKDIATEKASDAEDWAVGTRSDGESPQHSSESSKHYAQAADTSAGIATSMRNYALGFARESEGYAKGTQGGTPVDSSSPYYEANSKYYKEQAASSAAAASASEDKAKDWATRGEDLPVETGLYSALHWAKKSATSAGMSSVSAANAMTSEEKAEDWAEKAEDTEVETGKYSAKHHALKAAASATAADNARIASVAETISPDDGGENVITITFKDGTTKTFSVFNGHQGTIMYPAFDVDAATGSLIMYTDEDYTGVLFRLTAQGYIEAYRDIS